MKRPKRKAAAAKTEVLWIGCSAKHGYALPWLWGETKKACQSVIDKSEWNLQARPVRVRITPVRSKR